jgi:hypothetical protein
MVLPDIAGSQEGPGRRLRCGGANRPLIVPHGATNVALPAQYCEIPDDVVFTVEYSVRAAQTAEYTLLDVDKKVTPLCKGLHDPDTGPRFVRCRNGSGRSTKART